MKIFPLTQNLYVFSSQKPAAPLTVKSPIATGLSRDVCDISFKAFTAEPPVYLKNAVETGNVHCPICGTLILPREKFDDISNEAHYINDYDDFRKVLMKYNDYIPQPFKEKMFPLPENISMKDFVLQNYESSLKDYKNAVAFTKDYLMSYTKWLDEENKAKIADAASKLNENTMPAEFNKLVYQTINSSSIAPIDKSVMRHNISSCVEPYSRLLKVFDPAELDIRNDNAIAQKVLNNMFYYSVENFTNVTVATGYRDFPNNYVGLCKGCTPYKISTIFWESANIPAGEIAKNLDQYLKDVTIHIAKNIADPADKIYVAGFCLMNNKFFEKKYGYKPLSLHSFNNLFNVMSRKSDFPALDQSEVDIPCACCGSTMLPHDVRLIIQDEISNSTSHSQLAAILRKYDKYINLRVKNLSDMFIKLSDENPNISDDEFFELISKKIDGMFYDEMDDLLLQAIESTNNPFKGEIIKNQCEKIKEFVHSPEFVPFKFAGLFQNVLKLPDDSYIPKALFILTSKLRLLCYKYTIFKPNEFESGKDKHPLHSIVFDIFKADVSTVDHLVPVSKDGKNSKSNHIGLCKLCNTTKASESPLIWISHYPEIKPNLIKQLKIITQMSKDGKIEGFDNWAKSVLNNLYYSTYKKCDLRSMLDED